MRNGPVAALTVGLTKMEAIDKTVLISAITHFSPEPVITCVIHTLLIRKALKHHLAKKVELKPPTYEDIVKLIQVDWKKWQNESQNDKALLWLKTVKSDLSIAENKILTELKDFESFDPYSYYYKGVSGYCSLTLKISLWSLHWSFQEKDYPQIPSWLPSWPFKSKKFETIMLVVLIGADADTYGATAGALLAAYHPNISPNLTEGLKVVPVVKEYMDDKVKSIEELKKNQL